MGIATIVYPWCQKVLPLTYDDSLSYYEMICKLINKCNEIIKKLEGYDEVIAELQEAIKDIDTMKREIEFLQSETSRIDSDLAELNTVVVSLNQYVLELEKRVDDRFKQDEESISNLAQIVAKINTNFDAKIEALREELTTLFNSFTAEFVDELNMLQMKVNQMKINLQAQIDELKQAVSEIDTQVINPWHNELGKISHQKNVDLMYRDLADHVVLAKEYNEVGLTAQQYTNLGMTALDYVRFARERLKLHWVFSPTYGWRQEINNVLTSIVAWISGTMTANVYAEMELDADGYSALDLTAQDYYLFKPERVGLFVEDGVLQSQQYSLVEDDGVLKVYGGTATETDGVLTVT